MTNLHQRIRNLTYPLLHTANPAERLRGRLSHGALSQQATLQYIDANTRRMWTAIDGGLYWAMTPIVLYASGFWVLQEAYTYRLLDGTPNTDGSIAYSAGWTSAAGSSELNSTRSYSDNVVGRYAEFTVTGAKRIYIAMTKRSDSGYASITIDGSIALVNGNDLVDVSGQKCINTYNATIVYNTWFEIAKGLDPLATYTVRITSITAIPPGSANRTLYIEGFGVPCTRFTDANGTLVRDTVSLTKLTSGNNWGYAYTILPAGATLGENSGGSHGNEVISAVQWLNQVGADMTVSAGTPTNSANLIKLVQTGKTRHSETGVTDIADVATTMFFNWQGIRQTVSHTWLVAGQMVGGYVALIPGWGALLLKGYIAGGGNVTIALASDDDSIKGNKRSRCSMLFDNSHGFVIYAYIPNLSTVGWWANSVRFAYFLDGAAGTVNKIYFQRWDSSLPKNWAVSEVWLSEFWFGFGYKPGFVP